MRNRIITWLGLLLFLVIGNSTAQQGLYYKDFKKVAQAGFKFLAIGVGARNTAMGGAAVTNEGDAASLFWNPAGIASVTDRAIFVGYTSWIAQTSQQSAAAVFPLGTFGHVGLSALMMNYGVIKGTAISDNDIGYVDTGDLKPSSYSIGLTYARTLTDKFQFALTSKYCREDLTAMAQNTLAFDFGTIYHAGAHGIKIAVVMQNFVFKQPKYVKEEFMLPLTFRVGVSADMLSLAGMSSEISRFDMVLEAAKPRDFSERVHVGGEYWYRNTFAVRGGYRFNYDSEGLTVGVGMKMESFEIGYSYADFGAFLGNVSRLSAEIRF